MSQSQTESNTSNLIINYLPSSITECELAQLFSSIGEIRSTKIVRDRSTGISLGFGFVEYANEGDGTRAIAAFDGLSLQTKRLKVGYARPAGGIEGANLHIRNLDKSVSAKDVEEKFREYGEIVRARVLNDPQTGLSRGIAFVLFCKKDDAEKAVNELHGSVLPGFASQPLCVRFAVDNNTKARLLAMNGGMAPSIGFPTPNPGFPTPSPFIPQIPQIKTEMNLGTGYGAAYGGGPIRGPPIRHRFNPLSMMRHPGSAAGVVGMQHSLNAMMSAPHLVRQAGAMPNMRLPVPDIQQQIALPLPGDTNPGHCLFVYNLEPTADERDLWQLFGPFGAVKKVNVVYEKDKTKGKGYGFVTMLNFDEAMAAISHLNGFLYKERVLQVSLKTPKTEKPF